MDDGTRIQLKVSVDGGNGSAHFDFSGTGQQVAGNCNAPKAVTYSAIIYCMRCMVARDIPLNQGCLKPCTVVIPEGSILAPGPSAAVVGGNVLTSQRVVDVILKAFGACAASQGCMNNVTFGDDSFGYYETIAGGAGAGPGWHGRSGVHTHMTNTRITDVEIMERRYPVVVREFGLRAASGGAGAFSGGDGTVRELAFRRPIQLSLLTERRERAPYGLAGGADGEMGKNLLLKADGSVIRLDGKSSVLCQAGDALRLLSPGGGGFGQAGSGFAMTSPGGMQGVEAGEHIGHGAAGSLANYAQMQTSA
jgi:5-oxoprolinase (ATP-hydrolysing)